MISTLSLFVFSISFFGLMTDEGVFDVIVSKLTPLAKNSVTAVTIITAIVATISHLDGSGATTLLVTIPAMLPFYKKFNIRPQALMLITAMALGAMNIVPWGGPTMLSASIIGMDVAELWRPMIPVQIFLLGIVIVLAIIIAKIEIKNGAGIVASGDDELAKETAKPVNKTMLFINFALTIGTVALLIIDVLPANFIFMIATAIALVINVRSVKEQNERLRKYGTAAMTMTTTFLAMGVFTGVLTGTGILDAMALSVTSIIPEAVGPYIHIVIALFSVPLIMCLGTEALLVGVMPVVIAVAATYGIPADAVARALIITENMGVGVSPVSPAIYLGLGITGTDIGDHIKYSALWAWGISVIGLIFAVIIGVVPV